MKFSDIPGQEDVKRRLRELADSGRIPHALMLEGPAGAGKFALARAFAQYIHCQNHTPDGDSCGVCPSCRQHETFNHIDTIFSFPVVKKGQTTVSEDFMPEFRELLDENMFMDYESWLAKLGNVNAKPAIYVDEANALVQRLNYTAHSSKYKIVLMWLPEKLREEAANKLLKLIEEPHEDTLFVLCSDDSRQVLTTIYSRTQRIPVKRYEDSEISDYLGKTYGIDGADEVARLAVGNMTEAINALNVSKDKDKFLALFMSLMRNAYTRKVAQLKVWAADVAALGRERSMDFMDYCAHMIRENFVMNLHNPQLNYLTAEEAGFSRNFSPFINHRNVERIFEEINEAKIDVSMNANAKLVFFDFAVKMILFLK